MFQITRKQFSAMFLAALASIAGLTTLTAASDPNEARAIYDVAMNGLSFSYEGKTTPSGAPAKGTPFVVEGYVYPRGTFERYGMLSGVLADGSPEFPHLVIGTWVCKGWHLLDGDAPTGAVVSTTQSFDFDLERPGAEMLTTEGIELADFNIPFQRVVTGGTGRFRDADGQHTQIYVGDGLNITGGFNSTFGFNATSWH